MTDLDQSGTDRSEAQESARSSEASQDDYVDQELMNLSTAPPRLNHIIIVGLLAAMSAVMLTLFYPDFKYLLQGLGRPRHLGDASEIDLNKLKSNTYVSVEGIPWITKTIAFNEGVKWFAMSDNSQKLFPLSGQSSLFVQWTVPDTDKKYRNPLSDPTSPLLPGYFEGHLLRRDDLGRNYAKVWVFFKSRLGLESSEDTWVLIDGETPGDKWWVVVVYLLLATMIVTNVFKLRRMWIAWRS